MTLGLYCWRDFHRTMKLRRPSRIFSEWKNIPGHLLGLGAVWTPLVKSFAGHQILSPAVDAWLERKAAREEKKSHQLFWDLELCLISRSARAKEYLLEADEETGVITWDQARWLLQGWGMQDEEAAAVLTRLAESDVAKSVAHLLPDILPNKQTCRQRLLDILRTESGFGAGYATIGLIELGVNDSDEEAVEAAISRLYWQGSVRISFS